MGHNVNEDGIGEPVVKWKKPNVGSEFPLAVPVKSDNFDEDSLKLQWQWLANKKDGWYSLAANPDHLRLYAINAPNGSETLLYDVPNVLCQKISAPAYTVTTKVDFKPDSLQDRTGIMITGSDYSYLSLSKQSDGQEGLQLTQVIGHASEDTKWEQKAEFIKINETTLPLFLRVTIQEEALCTFSYSVDNIHFITVGTSFEAKPDHWVGAKVGIFCIHQGDKISQGYADFDWVKLTKNE